MRSMNTSGSGKASRRRARSISSTPVLGAGISSTPSQRKPRMVCMCSHSITGSSPALARIRLKPAARAAMSTPFTTSGKYGLVMSGMTIPRVIVRFIFRLRAIRLGR